VTLRGRGEPPDLVEVNLPARPLDDSFVIRIPERGGLAREDSGLPRGQLFLRIEAADGSDPSASVAKVVSEVVAARRALDQPIAERRLPPWLVPAAVALAVSLAALAWLLFHSR
jgi:hypothetical protein